MQQTFSPDQRTATIANSYFIKAFLLLLIYIIYHIPYHCLLSTVNITCYFFDPCYIFFQIIFILSKNDFFFFFFYRFISTAGSVPSTEHCTRLPPCYANVSSGASLHRHTPCIFWGACCIRVQIMSLLTVFAATKPASVVSVCRYTSPDTCFHLRCLASCLRCPLPTRGLKCTCPCSLTCLLARWARMYPWLTIPWEPCTLLAPQWWWIVALMLVRASQQAAAWTSPWVPASSYSSF